MPCLIRERKTGIFHIVTTAGGKRKWRSTGTRNRKEAYQIFLQSSETHPANESPKLSSAIQEYLNYARTNFAPKTQEIYDLSLKHFLAVVGDVDLDTINPLAIERYKSERAKGVKPATVNIELRAMKAFFNCLKKWRIIGDNPCDGVRQLKIPDQPPLFFSPDQLKALLAAMKDDWIRDIVIFTAMTGLRLGEVVNLSWTDVNLESRTIVIKSSQTYQVKGGKMRIIPLNRTSFDLLQRKTPKEGYVFKGKRGGRANPNFVSEKLRERVRALGFDRRLHFHSLRHTFASLLVSKNVSLYQVQKLLGHSSPQITEVYAHLQKSAMHDVVNLLAI